MASPQKENGYTPIANELMDALVSFRIPGEVRQIFDAIIRKTYGFNKKEDFLANSQIVEMTELDRRNVSRALKKLRDHKLVIKTDDKVKINKDYTRWIPFVIKTDDKVKVSSKRMTVVINTDDKVSSVLTDTKDIKTIPKDKGSAEALPAVKKNKIILQGKQWNELIDPFEKVNPMFRRIYRNKTQRVALQELAQTLGIERLKWTIEHLNAMTGKKYAPKITTPCQLADKLGELQTFWRQEKEIKNKGKQIIGL